MNLGVTLKKAEKAFGPALPGRGDEETTLSAMWYAAGKGKKFAGLRGIREEARFYVHFPVRVDWSWLESKKGVPDFVSDLKESGPQGEQGREALAREFLSNYKKLEDRHRQKREATEKKDRTARQKKELAALRPRLAGLAGEQLATFSIGSESFTLPVKITVSKNGKIKVSATI
jgi:hypothetical protein